MMNSNVFRVGAFLQQQWMTEDASATDTGDGQRRRLRPAIGDSWSPAPTFAKPLLLPR